MLDLFALVLTSCLIIYFIFRYHLSDARIRVRALLDGQSYLVRNSPQSQETAETLARINMKLEPFLKSLNVSPDPEYRGFCARLLERYNPEALSEGRIEKGLTSYTINKGDAIVLCLRSRDDRETLFDENLLMYVVLHEYLLQKAEAAALFQPVQGDINCCGLNLRGGTWPEMCLKISAKNGRLQVCSKLKLQDPSSWVAFDHSTELEGYRASVLVDPSSGPPIFCEKFVDCDYKNKPALLAAIFAYGNLVPAGNGLTQVGKFKIC
ncbi:hypothetical protein BJ741DRAFT_715863, partial [Chytriomyces cf. hyalinus JEL632]